MMAPTPQQQHAIRMMAPNAAAFKEKAEVQESQTTETRMNNEAEKL